MKNELKFIKLFEAFESERLSKVLGYAKDRKKDFMSHLKYICDHLNFPFSELSDNYIEYLPFSKALKKVDNLDDVPCDNESDTIKGEFCNKGKIKRTWGKGSRMIECPKCGGTGVKPKSSSDIKLIKFWFNSDGRYLTFTCVDGMKIKIHNNETKRLKPLSEYDIDRKISLSEMSSLSEGDIVKVNVKNTNTNKYMNIVCYIHKSRITYFLQNEFGETCNPNHDLSKIGKYFFQSDNPTIKSIEILKPKSPETTDPYTWNSLMSLRPFRSERKSIKDVVKDAHFALILDLSKLKASKYETTSDIRSKRRDSKLDSTYLKDNEDIKSENIERYISKLVDKSKVSENIKDVNNVIKRITGGKNILFMLVRGSIINAINNITANYVKIILDEDKNYYMQELNNNIRGHVRRQMNTSSIINNSLKEIKNILAKNNDTIALNIIKELEEISNIIYNSIKSINIQTIDDIEILLQKLSSVKQIFSYERYSLEYINNILDDILNSNPNSAANRFTNGWYVDNIRRDIPKRIGFAKAAIEKIFN